MSKRQILTITQLVVLGFVIFSGQAHKANAEDLPWTSQKSGTDNLLWDVYFVDGNNGWVVGNSGTLLTTSDGGATWVSQLPRWAPIGLNSIYFVDKNNGWAVGWGESNVVILKTSNGGATWVHQKGGLKGILDGVHFVDVNNGWVVGRIPYYGTIVILRISDDGATWVLQKGGVKGNLADVHFIDDMQRSRPTRRRVAWLVKAKRLGKSGRSRSTAGY